MRQPGAIMSYIPPAVKDALLLVMSAGLVVVVLLQVKQNNVVRERQHDSCASRRELADQGNRSAFERRKLSEALEIFVDETRRARGDMAGTSYDPAFAVVIDTRVKPRLSLITARPIPVPATC